MILDVVNGLENLPLIIDRKNKANLRDLKAATGL